MPLLDFSCRDFRCLEAVEFEPAPGFSVITGPNASGKTSILEGIGYLGLGRSFRGTAAAQLVRHGVADFLLRARVSRGGAVHRVGVQHGRGGLRQSIDGDTGGGLGELAALLPLQVVDPEVHSLIGGPPEARRRFVDWIGFHVEPGFLELWRRFRRALRQRNAALRSGGRDLSGWDREFMRAAVGFACARERVLQRAVPALEATAATLLGTPVHFEYRRGWGSGKTLEEALRDGERRDREQGSTRAGPQRADLRLCVDERLAKRLVSRGQQKLLAAAMVLAAAEVVQTLRRERLLLLLDDPAAELDAASLTRLLAAVDALGCQVIATSLSSGGGPFPATARRFHVERGQLSALD